MPIIQELGGSQGRSRRVRKIASPTGIRSPDRPARSESLYRLSYWRTSNKTFPQIRQQWPRIAFDLGPVRVVSMVDSGTGCQCHSTNAPYFRASGRNLLAQWRYFGRKQLHLSHLLRSLSYVSLSFSFCRFYYFFPLSVSASLFASLLHFPSYPSACCSSPAGNMSSILLHSMITSVLYHGMVKQLRYETHVFVPKGKSACFACENVAELSNCYQLHCILTHSLSGAVRCHYITIQRTEMHMKRPS